MITHEEALVVAEASLRGKQWREWCRNLRTQHPASLPIRVVRRPMRKHHGLTAHCGSHFLITVDSSLPNDIAWMILLHEWAHALTWDRDDGQPDIDHNDAWGIAYAMLWRDNHGDADFAPE